MMQSEQRGTASEARSDEPSAPTAYPRVRLDVCYRQTEQPVVHTPECQHASRDSGFRNRAVWENGLTVEEATRRVRAGEVRPCESCRGDWYLTPAPTVTVCGICHMTVCDCEGGR